MGCGDGIEFYVSWGEFIGIRMKYLFVVFYVGVVL